MIRTGTCGRAYFSRSCQTSASLPNNLDVFLSFFCHYIKIYFLRSQDRTLCVSAHHYKRGGASHVCFTGDSQHVLSTGADGVLACWVWNFTSTGNMAIDYVRIHYTGD